MTEEKTTENNIEEKKDTVPAEQSNASDKAEKTEEKTAESKEQTAPASAGSQKKSSSRNSRGQRNDGKGGRGRGKGRGRGRGRGQRTEKEFAEEVLEVARVTRVVKGGRRLRFRVTVVIGNRKGKVGLGTGKATEVAAAVQKGIASAKKNLIKVPMKKGTIPHEIKWKHKGARILLMPASEGTGIIAGGALRKIADLAGIENILGKSYGTNSKLVNAQAMIQALQSFQASVKESATESIEGEEKKKELKQKEKIDQKEQEK